MLKKELKVTLIDCLINASALKHSLYMSSVATIVI